MKGVILTNGYGIRFRPFTYLVNKSVLPVYDKPIIYFPIRTLLSAGIDDILINAHNPEEFEKVLRDENFPAKITFVHEDMPRGTKFSLYGMRSLIQDEPILVVLGDMYLPFKVSIPRKLENCTVFVSSHYDPKKISEYGVAELDGDRVISFQEKPKDPKGKHVHMGTTFFPKDLIARIEEAEIKEGEHLTDLANQFLRIGRLFAKVHGQPWFNVGTPEDALLAALFRREQIRG